MENSEIMAVKYWVATRGHNEGDRVNTERKQKPPQLKTTKIARGWYFQHDHKLHIVATHYYNNPDRKYRTAIDWVAVETEEDARKIWNGSHISNSGVLFVQNSKHALLRYIAREKAVA